MEKKFDAIFLMGPQGSGKGTQAKILAEKLGFFHWEMGGILRTSRDVILSSGSTVGSVIDQGIYLSDEDLQEIILQKLPEIPKDQGIIFDGVPRRIGQAEFILDWLKNNGRHDLLTLVLTLSREESFKRLSLRAEIEKRADDTPEKIELRLKQYEEATLPVLDFMRQNTEYVEIDGMPSIPEVTEAIFSSLGL